MNAPLERLAIEAADAWIEWWKRELEQQGRAMAGGWPGTLSEARARVAAHIATALGKDHVLDTVTLDALMHCTYKTARSSWLSRASREPST